MQPPSDREELLSEPYGRSPFWSQVIPSMEKVWRAPGCRALSSTDGGRRPDAEEPLPEPDTPEKHRLSLSSPASTRSSRGESQARQLSWTSPKSFRSRLGFGDLSEESPRFRAVAASPVLREANEFPPAEKPKVDFSGEWICTRVEGDFDTFLKELGVGYMLRTAASAFGYGVNRLTNRILQTDAVIEIHTWSPRGDQTLVLHTDGVEQDTVDVEGNPIKAVARWEDAVLVISCRRLDSSDKMPLTRRYITGGEMCIHQTSPGGITIERYFARA